MDRESSRTLIELIETGDLQSAELADLLAQYFRENSDVIWKDALLEHGLLIDEILVAEGDRH